MTKMELATGMFGMDDGDKLIFEGGKYSNIDDLDENLMFNEDAGIDALYEARCFQQVKDGRGKLIWKRPEPAKEVEEATESEEGKVTITEDQFFEVVKKANEIFMDISKKVPTPGSEMIDVAMGLQNIIFGALVSSVLFGKEIN